MKKFTTLFIATLAFAGAANAQVRWNPENSWATDNGATILAVGEDGKSVVNKLGKLDNGNWRADIRYAATANLTEDEPYMVFQITTEGCAWNLNDFKFVFMLQRKLSEGLNEEGNVVWGGSAGHGRGTAALPWWKTHRRSCGGRGKILPCPGCAPAFRRRGAG